MDDFKNYLLRRGLFDPVKASKEEILDNEERLAKIAELFNTYKDALNDLLLARINGLRDQVYTEIAPHELIIYRQAMIEVATIFDDAMSFATEYNRRKEEKEGQATNVPDNQTPDEAPATTPTNEDNSEQLSSN